MKALHILSRKALPVREVQRFICATSLGFCHVLHHPNQDVVPYQDIA